MSSREKILKEIAKAKPAALPLPQPFLPPHTDEDLTQKFLRVLQSIGGKAEVVQDLQPVAGLMAERTAEGVRVINAMSDANLQNPNEFWTHAAEMESVHTVFLKGGIAVAENAAVWVPERAMRHRLLPFICQELVMVIEEKSIVANMHAAYGLIRVNDDGYGVFIAGPSKTADIEQSLVIGAHGPLALTVFVVENGAV